MFRSLGFTFALSITGGCVVDVPPLDGGVFACETNDHCAAGYLCDPNGVCVAEGGDGDGDVTPAVCGNGHVEQGEACDDGNATSQDGCEADCSYSCVNDLGCPDDNDDCNGVVECSLAEHRCLTNFPLTTGQQCLTPSNNPGTCVESGTSTTCQPNLPECAEDSECDDGLDCTENLCDGDTCTYPPLDGDADGSPCGLDCDDGDASVHPGADELPGDELDSDCNGQEDCFQDQDEDGSRGPELVVSMDPDCRDPGELPATAPTDCCDTDPNVFPGQTMYFSMRSGCGGFDFDCNGEERRRWNQQIAGPCSFDGFGPGCTLDPNLEGWTAAVPPACGVSSQWYANCHNVGATSCGFDTSMMVQECR